MRINYTGCAICDSTWGNVWEEVEGERRFFCCAVCAAQFKALLGRLRERTGWERIDALEISGDRRGRTVVAARGEERFRCAVAFNAQGEIRWFESAAPPSPAATD